MVLHFSSIPSPLYSTNLREAHTFSNPSNKLFEIMRILWRFGYFAKQKFSLQKYVWETLPKMKICQIGIFASRKIVKKENIVVDKIMISFLVRKLIHKEHRALPKNENPVNFRKCYLRTSGPGAQKPRKK